MTADDQKTIAAQAALDFVENGMLIGVGTGTTVNRFIDALANSSLKIKGAVPSSVRTDMLLRKFGIPVIDLNDVRSLPIYIDGADEISPDFAMIKGGGGALTREKIVSSVAHDYICIADASKQVDRLGGFPLPIEVISMARESVIRKLAEMGGIAQWRKGVVTDNGHDILDVTGLDFSDPVQLEMQLDCIPGVVECGVFALRRANTLVLGANHGAEIFVAPTLN